MNRVFLLQLFFDKGHTFFDFQLHFFPIFCDNRFLGIGKEEIDLKCWILNELRVRELRYLLALWDTKCIRDTTKTTRSNFSADVARRWLGRIHFHADHTVPLNGRGVFLIGKEEGVRDDFHEDQSEMLRNSSVFFCYQRTPQHFNAILWSELLL